MQCAILELAEWKEILVMLLFRFAKKNVAHCNSEVKWEALKIFVKKFLEYTLLLDSRTVIRGLFYGLKILMFFDFYCIIRIVLV